MALQEHPTFPHFSPSNHVRMSLGRFHFEKHPALGFVRIGLASSFMSSRDHLCRTLRLDHQRFTKKNICLLWITSTICLIPCYVFFFLEMRQHNWNSWPPKTNRNTGPQWDPFQLPTSLSPAASVAFDLPMTLDAADAQWVVAWWELRGKFLGKCEENPPCSSLSMFKGFSVWHVRSDLCSL